MMEAYEEFEFEDNVSSPNISRNESYNLKNTEVDECTTNTVLGDGCVYKSDMNINWLEEKKVNKKNEKSNSQRLPIHPS